MLNEVVVLPADILDLEYSRIVDDYNDYVVNIIRPLDASLLGIDESSYFDDGSNARANEVFERGKFSSHFFPILLLKKGEECCIVIGRSYINMKNEHLINKINRTQEI